MEWRHLPVTYKFIKIVLAAAEIRTIDGSIEQQQLSQWFTYVNSVAEIICIILFSSVDSDEKLLSFIRNTTMTSLTSETVCCTSRRR